jgi:hypothetical protein
VETSEEPDDHDNAPSGSILRIESAHRVCEYILAIQQLKLAYQDLILQNEILIDVKVSVERTNDQGLLPATT